MLARELLRASADAAGRPCTTATSSLLLDEFQDTDPIQIELAVRIAGAPSAERPRTGATAVVAAGRLFVVGDPKQSIYRFRRATSRLYLEVQAVIGEPASLTTNFRSVPGVVDWVNGVFGQLIHRDGGRAAALRALWWRTVKLAPNWSDLRSLCWGPTCTKRPPPTSSAWPRPVDAADAIAQILNEGWTIWDEPKKAWRRAEPADIAILLPSRASMPMLEDALDRAGIHFRAESMSLVYEAAEVRDLLMIARAVADPSDQLALVTALRTPWLGCGDDDLFRWKQAEHGRMDLFSRVDDPELATGPVGLALDYLRSLHKAARWLTPSEVLGKIVADRRFLELAAYQPRTRDSWRRIRFVVDQARAWTEISHGGLRAYLDWVAHQAQEKSRVSEAILPEHDVEAVRVMTIHAAKGLEFPIVVLSGMSTQPRTEYGVRLIWTDDDYTVAFNKSLREVSFEAAAELDEQMDDYERIRLMYVGATRARDHLVVSMHRKERGDAARPTPAELLASVGAHEVGAPDHFELDARKTVRSTPPASVSPPPTFDTWIAGLRRARQSSRKLGAITASGLEGTDPEVMLAEADAGLAKGPRDIELPPWSKGRYGSAVGRAVHGALQVINLATGDGLGQAVRAQVLAEAITDLEDVVTRLVESALASEIVQRAAARRHWREAYVGAPGADGVLVEGIIDLLYEEDDGSLIVVDYKTDVVRPEKLDDKITFYTPQMRAYRDALNTATGRRIDSRLLFLHPNGSHLAVLWSVDLTRIEALKKAERWVPAGDRDPSAGRNVRRSMRPRSLEIVTGQSPRLKAAPREPA